MDVLLIHPPFADPTQPYLSLPTLKGALRARGLDARVLDLNVEAAHWLFSPPALEHVARRIGSRFIDLNRQEELSFEEQREYRRIVESRPKIERILGARPTPLEVFQSRELFYDPARYATARREVEGTFDALGAAYFPYRFGFNHAAHSVLPWSFDLLEQYASGRHSPLREFYESFFATADQWDWSAGEGPPVAPEELSLVGISVVFPSQIPEALHLCRFLRERAPQAMLVLGGPCIHQVAVHLEPALQRRLLSFVDAIGLFEGEETLCELVPKLAAWRETSDPAARFELFRTVPNLLVLDPANATPVVGPRHTLDLAEAAAPDYTDLDLDRYWAPSRTLLYAPTRGCYWNQCSFCYYGLSESATAKYREIPPERAASDLAQLSRRHGVKHVYLSCDVLSPSYAIRFAEALIEKGVKIRWSSDLKIEKHFTPERCELLYRSGLRSAAFGIESGSDRILELMRKGTDRATMTAVNQAFHDAGVATEWMTFTDHPDESVDEALETVAWIEEQRDKIDLFIVGEFGLERGSHIAQDPARYGVRKVFWAEGDELRLYAMFTQRSGRRSADAKARVENAIDRVAAPYALHPYPWAGANSTHHTFLHFLEFGQSAFKTHFQKAGGAYFGAEPEAPRSHITGLRERPRFPLAQLVENEQRFFAEWLPRALYTTLPARRSRGAGGASGVVDEVAMLSEQSYRAAIEGLAPLRG
jgi:anaerobic magnesium-protoporphyrin IX monomethyl ester cyclase